MKRYLFFSFMLLFVFAVKAQNKSGLWLLENEQFIQAKEVFLAQSQSNASNSEAAFRCGWAYYQLGVRDSAKFFWQKGSTLNGKYSGMCKIGLGRLLLEDGDVVQAKVAFASGLLGNEKDIEVLLLLADSWGNCKQNQNAIEGLAVINKVVAIDKKNVEAMIVAGDIYSRQPEGGGNAMTKYETATDYNPNSVKAFTRIGMLYARARNYNESLSAFQKGLAADSLYLPTYREMGDLYYQSKQYEKAKEVYSKYIAQSEYTVATSTRYAYILFLAKDYAGATERINSIIKTDTTNAILSRLIGYSYYEQSKFPEGVSFMEKFFAKADPKKIIASDYEYYGKLLAKTKQDSLAIENLQKAYSLDTSSKELLSDIGKSYYSLKKYPSAIEAFLGRINLGKPLVSDYFVLGQSYYYSKDFLRADSAFLKVATLQPASYLGFFWRGRCNQILDSTYKSDVAKVNYEQALTLLLPDPVKNKKNIIESYNYIAYYSVMHDDTKTALENYKKIVEIDPENKEALQNIKDIEKRK